MAIQWPDSIDVGDNAYWLIVITMMSGFMLAVLGVLLGIANLVRHAGLQVVMMARSRIVRAQTPTGTRL